MKITQKRISDLMHDKKVSQQQLADYIQITQATLSRNLADPEKMNINTITKIATFFNVSLDYLLGRTNDPKQIIQIIEKIESVPDSPLSNTPEYKAVIKLISNLNRDELIMLKGMILAIIGNSNNPKDDKRIIG